MFQVKYTQWYSGIHWSLPSYKFLEYMSKISVLKHILHCWAETELLELQLMWLEIIQASYCIHVLTYARNMCKLLQLILHPDILIIFSIIYIIINYYCAIVWGSYLMILCARTIAQWFEGIYKGLEIKPRSMCK